MMQTCRLLWAAARFRVRSSTLLEAAAEQLVLSRQELSPDMISVLAWAPVAVEHTPGTPANYMHKEHDQYYFCSRRSFCDDCNVV
jgi:hypothetical protein